MLAAEHDDVERRQANARKIKNVRARHIASGRSYVYVHLPTELVEACDRLKDERRLIGRGVVIEEALREYLTKNDRA